MAWYAKFDGVDGSAQHKDHKGWCNAQKLNMRGSKAGAGGTGQGRIGGKMHLDDISLDIITDKGLPKLLQAADNGQVFSKVEIHGTATYGNAGEQVYLAVELANVQITRYDLGVLDNDAATDNLLLALNYEKYKTTFTAYSKEGKSEGKVEHEWKVEEGES